MALFNYASKEITLKVVYYGPGLCGKTTNLQQLHEHMSSDKKGKLLSLSTDADRTLFFDFMPVQLGKIKDFNIRFQLYTVPGQVRYNATRKLVLKGADAIVFVADSQTAMKEQNVESLQNMKENLTANNINPDEIPVLLQYNKRDLKKIMPVDEMNADLNPKANDIIEASAYEGWGVEDTFHVVTKMLLKFISKKHNVKIDEEDEKAEALAPDAASKDRINISIEDKANRLLEGEEPIAAEPAPAEPVPAEPVPAEPVQADAGGGSADWDGLLGTSADAQADAGPSEWESGSIDLETDGTAPAAEVEPVAEPEIEEAIIEPEEDILKHEEDILAASDPGGDKESTSELERMLMEEEEGGASDEDVSGAGGEGDLDSAAGSAAIDELKAEVEELKNQNKTIRSEINKIREQIRPVLKLMKKKTAK